MQKNKKGPLSHQKIKCLFFELCSTSDDRPSYPSKKHRLKCKIWKRTRKSSKNKMFIFGLCSTSDDRPSDLSKKCQPKCKKMKKAPLSHQKIKCSFLDYIQLLMIGRVIWVTNGDWNAKKGLLSHLNWCSFSDNTIPGLAIATPIALSYSRAQANPTAERGPPCQKVKVNKPSTETTKAKARFATFLIFSHRSGSEWLGMANFTWFATFPIFSHQSGS